MIRNARDVMDNQQLLCDVCIVGAGAAGITLARELASSKLSVIVLESGGLSFDEEVQALYQGELKNPVYNDPMDSRLRFFGGSTNHWAGNCSPLDAIDFERRPWLAHSGWPFSRSDLDPFYERAQAYCQLGPFNYEPIYWQQFRKQKALPLDPKIISNGVVQFSPPTRFGEVYRNDLGAAQNVFVYLNANVLDITLLPDGEVVDSVIAGTLDGKRFSVKAERFVLALGGIENARMLLNCDKVHPNGIGNRNDLVGRYFMDHPVVTAATFKFTNPKIDLGLYTSYPPMPGPSGRVSCFLQLSDAIIRERALNNFRAPLVRTTRFRASEGVESLHQLSVGISAGNMPDNLGNHIGNIIRDIDMVIEGISRKHFGAPLFDSANDRNFLYSDVMIEQRPDADNRILLSSERDRLGLRKIIIDWRLQDADKENLWRGMEILAQEFGRADLGRIRIEGEHEGRTFGDQLSLGDHHMGTTRAHLDPQHGVVDADLKIHGVANLYVAGSSVFPTGGHVPPTLTIVALAIRLSEHIRQLGGKV